MEDVNQQMMMNKKSSGNYNSQAAVDNSYLMMDSAISATEAGDLHNERRDGRALRNITSDVVNIIPVVDNATNSINPPGIGSSELMKVDEVSKESTAAVCCGMLDKEMAVNSTVNTTSCQLHRQQPGIVSGELDETGNMCSCMMEEKKEGINMTIYSYKASTGLKETRNSSATMQASKASLMPE